MIKKLNLLLGFIVFVATTSVAQVQSDVPVNGSPYLDEKYVEGVIHFANKIHSAPMRYNAYQDLIEYQQKGQAMVLDANATIKKVIVGNTTFVPLKYSAEGKSKFGYFTVLDSGKVTLYAKRSIVFMAGKKGGSLDGSDKPAEFDRRPDVFYVKVGDGVLQEVGNIKSLIATFPDKQDELSQFAKKEKISPKKEKEIVQLIQYYNSL